MAKISEMEYVYDSGETLGFRKVKVETYIEDDVVLLKLLPEHMMTVNELSGMLGGIQKDLLDRRDIKLSSDCEVEMLHNGKSYKVEIASGSSAVKGIVPV